MPPVEPPPHEPPAPGPRFDAAVPDGGYAWWYVDAVSDDGRDSLTVIGFVGSVFSPYYAAARRRGPADPNDHCALNVGLYGATANRWTMTERPREQVSRSARRLELGPSAMDFDGRSLLISVDERTAPLPGRIRGTIRVRPSALVSLTVPLDTAGRHVWTPYAPCARVEVELDQPLMRWSGNGYFDGNAGAEPIEAAFSRWTWSRADLGDGVAVLYDASRRDHSRLAFGLRFAADGDISRFETPPAESLPRSGWRIRRATPTDPGTRASIVRTLIDAPFYARSLIRSSVLGREAMSVHESLCLDRFSSRIVQAMLPFRMPRAWRGARRGVAQSRP
jgi:carotenoid 1,2-hydratase